MASSSEFPGSGLNVWFRDDIQNALRAIDTANEDLFETIDTPEIELYRRGYQAAIRAVAEAFGMRYETLTHGREVTPAIIDITPAVD